jgi:hypothetical protein
MIRLECACGRKIAAPDAWLGKRVKCPQCGQPVLVVPADAPPDTPAAQAPLSNSEAGESAAIEASAIPAPSPVSTSTITDEQAEPPGLTEGKPPAEPAAASETAAAPTEPPPAPSAKPPRLIAPRAPLHAQAQLGQATYELEDDEEDFESKQARLPRFLGVLGILVALGAAASCWIPEIDPWTLYIALGGVALATLGFGIAMSRHRIGLAMPLVGLFVSLLAMALPFALPQMGRLAPAQYVARAEQARHDIDEAATEAQSRGILSVDWVRLTGNKGSLAPEVQYRLINRSGKVIRLIQGSIQLSDRDHRALGGLSLNLSGPIDVGAAVEGKNNWTMEDATQAALADHKANADYKAGQVLYDDGTIQNFTQ